jgi:hypothetical protein
MLRTVGIVLVVLIACGHADSQVKKKLPEAKSEAVRYVTFVIPDSTRGMVKLYGKSFKAKLKAAGFTYRLRDAKLEFYLEDVVEEIGLPAVIVSDENNKIYQSKGRLTGDPDEVLRLLKIKK